MAKEKHINKVHYGEIHFYYTLCFEPTLSFDEMCDAIYNSDIVLDENKMNKVVHGIEKAIIDSEDEIKNDPAISDYTESLEVPETPNDYIELLPNDFYYYVDENSEDPLTFSCHELDLYLSLYETINGYKEQPKKVYGHLFEESHEHFILTPFMATLYNGNPVWIVPHLYMFKNNYAILKVELPLYDVDVLPLMNYNPNQYISNIHNRWNLNHFPKDCQIEQLYEVFIENLHYDLDLNFLRADNNFRNIVLISYENMPIDFTRIDPITSMDLFRIVSAPIEPNGAKQFDILAKEYMQKNQWSPGMIKYLTKTTGGCLSILDTTSLNTLKEKLPFPINYESHKYKEQLHFYKAIANIVSYNTDFSFMIIMLEKAMRDLPYYTKKHEFTDMYSARKRYNDDSMFLSEIQTDCYGSVSEQILFFKENMPFYFKSELQERKITALDDNISLFNQQQELLAKDNHENFQNIISLGGLLFTLFFGLSAISESLTILRSVLGVFIKNDIAYISVDNISVIVWLLITVFICRMLSHFNPIALSLIKHPIKFIKTIFKRRENN